MKIGQGNGNQFIAKQRSVMTKREDPYKRFQDMKMKIDEQIQKVKEDQEMSKESKEVKIGLLEEQKMAIDAQIQQLKMEELERSGQEKKEKESLDRPLTPLEEIEAERGVEYIPSEGLIKAANALDNSRNKRANARSNVQEADILKSQMMTDGKPTGYKMNEIAELKASAKRAELSSMGDLNKANEQVEKSAKQTVENLKKVEVVEQNEAERTEKKKEMGNQRIRGEGENSDEAGRQGDAAKVSENVNTFV